MCESAEASVAAPVTTLMVMTLQERIPILYIPRSNKSMVYLSWSHVSDVRRGSYDVGLVHFVDGCRRGDGVFVCRCGGGGGGGGRRTLLFIGGRL